VSENQATDFVHLHVHSEYSLLDGAAKIQELVKAAANQGMHSLALTDHGVMYGAISFYKACKEHGIKPIIGCEIYFTAGSRFDKGNRKDFPIYHLILLAKNDIGYRNLMSIVSIAQLEGNHYRPRADEEVLRAHSEGIICLSACLGGEINQHLIHDRYDEAKKAALRYYDIFGEDFYLELQDHSLLEQKRANGGLLKLASELSIPLVATNDVHYIKQQHSAMQEVLICIGTGKTMQDQDRLIIGTDQLYLKMGTEMARLFQAIPEAIANTIVIADKCNLTLQLGGASLPQFWPIPQGENSSSFLKILCAEGLEHRFARLSEWNDDSTFRQAAHTRLDYELSVIERMGYSDYFLIVWDFIRFARERGIRVGPGRGSSAGSLVAYTLTITDVDPLKYNLLFERFLNPERISMPDIDIDFDDERRDEVIQYVAAKYGEEHVAQIITFGTMAAKAAIRDVGRVLNISYQETDRAAKLIPNMLGVTIAQALEMNDQFKTIYEQSASTRELLTMAMQVEGYPRHSSTHAAGVVISAQPLTNYTPLQAGNEQMSLTQYAMEHLEALGLLKMDFLGLRTLSILERSHRWVERLHQIKIDFHDISDEDPLTYEMLGKGETTGIFQLESMGVRKVLKDMKPSSFEDIVSVLALYRPGPMEFIPKYIDGKHGRIHVEYPHDSIQHILQDTYGIIVYQEQIMQIASTMAGFSLGEADLLRRAVSKKKREILDEERAHFVNGSIATGHDEGSANNVYDMIVRFADYGFPRAHAVAYGVLAFQTAWFKAHYPAIFMSSMLASVAGNMRKTPEYVDECKRMGIAIQPPSVNESFANFTPSDGGIRFGLSAIKNVGTQAIEAILAARQEKRYESLLDFCKRVDLRVVNKRVLESLILAGALDGLDGHRAQLLAGLDETLEVVTKWKKQRDELQIELFGFEEVQNWDVELPEIRAFTMTEQIEHEYELLGMYLSGHPLDSVTEALEEEHYDRLIELEEMHDGSKVVVVARVSSLKPFTSKSGQSMAFLEVEDRVLRVETVMFAGVWRKVSQELHKDQIVLMLATLQKQDDVVKLLADDVMLVTDQNLDKVKHQAIQYKLQAERVNKSAQAKTLPKHSSSKKTPAMATENVGSKPSKVFIKITKQNEKTTTLNQLKQLLQQHKGNSDVVLFYEQSGQMLALNHSYRVKPNAELGAQIEQILGKGTYAIK